MGVVAGFESAPADLWPRILARAVEAGIGVDEQGEEEGLFWCTCRRGRATLWLGLETTKPVDNVSLFCGALRFWSRPRSTRRLFRDMIAIVRSCVGSTDS